MNAREPEGRNCPLRYRYRPGVFDREPAFRAETVYVIGGLYGNQPALDRIFALRAAEQSAGHNVRLIFNGDFNWFNIDSAGFAAINRAVLEHDAIVGNVEAELSQPSAGAGCGCNYPPYVDRGEIERADLVMQALAAKGREFPDILRRLGALPMHLTIQVGDARIGILHGDPESLAGWGLAVENIAPRGSAFGHASSYPPTTVDRIAGWFRQSNVLAFASTHSCLPFGVDFSIDGKRRAIFNNGAAGMPNFCEERFGLVTRISSDSRTPDESVYGVCIDDVRFDAIAVRYDEAAWLADFEANWPPGSPAHRSYFRRLTQGPDFAVAQAVLGGVRRTR